MKKYFVAALAAIAALLTLSSCEDKSLKFYDLEIKVDESGFDSEVPVPDAYQVTFTNTNTGEVLGFTTVNKKISVLQIPGKDEWYIVYHRINKNYIDPHFAPGIHREVCIDRLTFDKKGKIVEVTPTLNSPFCK